MSQDVNESFEAVERQRRLLYERLTDQQLIMATLFYILQEVSPSHHEALKHELLDRFQLQPKDGSHGKQT